MSFLKRGLNEDIGGLTEPPNQRGELSREYYQYYSSENDMPSLVNQSWGELYSDLLSGVSGELSADLQEKTNPPNTDGDTSCIDFNSDVELGIELWATQAFLEGSEVFPETTVATSAHSLSTNPPELMCYGMIYRVATKVVGDMLKIDQKLSSRQVLTSDDTTTKFCVRKSPNESGLRFLDDTEFGLLNVQISQALDNLFNKPLIQFEALGSTLTIRETISKATKSADAVVHVNINIYGPAGLGEEVGRQLSKHHVYLQRPDHVRTGSVYDNPHYLKFEDMNISSLEHRPVGAGNHPNPPTDSEQFQKTISDVYSSLTRSTKLSRVTGDRRIRTSLLPHQQEALDFMTQRENGLVASEFCLWKPMSGEYEGWYCHAVTNARTRIQTLETGGGILADEMGMGKSLSILALVANHLESADTWAQTAGNGDEYTSNKKRNRATLVIVPSAILINEWLNEIKIHLDGSLKTLKYHGLKRKEIVSHIDDADIVLTTYHTLVSDFKAKPSPLHEIEWFRIVLDEAHIIRRQVTTFYRAVSDLHARSRWCLTGTPIQNRFEDVGALIAFIRARPFHNTAMFRRFVTIPYEESEERRALAIRNLTLLLDSLCLRRATALLHLPAPRNQVRMVEFSDEEREQYEQTKKTMNRALRQKVGEAYSKSIFGIFQVQLQLRILCNHGTFQHLFSWKRSLMDEREDAECMIGGNGQVTCSTCRQFLPVLGSNNLFRTFEGNCTHVLCLECLDGNEEISKGTSDELQHCPLCILSGVPAKASGIRVSASHSSSPYLRPQGHSSKMSQLISDIKEKLWETKSIVFSCWTNTLNLLERYLDNESIPFYRIDGESTLPRRQKILDDFSKASEIRVLIMTTGTGAFGLNLTSANRIFIIEPQWNPSVESQAIARAIRLKQKHSVLVTRYIVAGTVEQEMRSQQERKLKMISGIGNSA